MQVDQNLFRPGSVGSLLFASESRFGGAGFQGGYEITSITQSCASGAPRRGRPAARPAQAARGRPVRRPRSRSGWTTP